MVLCCEVSPVTSRMWSYAVERLELTADVVPPTGLFRSLQSGTRVRHGLHGTDDKFREDRWFGHLYVLTRLHIELHRDSLELQRTALFWDFFQNSAGKILVSKAPPMSSSMPLAWSTELCYLRRNKYHARRPCIFTERLKRLLSNAISVTTFEYGSQRHQFDFHLSETIHWRKRPNTIPKT